MHCLVSCASGVSYFVYYFPVISAVCSSGRYSGSIYWYTGYCEESRRAGRSSGSRDGSYYSAPSGEFLCHVQLLCGMLLVG